MKKRVLAAILFFSVIFSSTAFADTKAVTYFGNEWPVNFLNSEHAQAEEDFSRIKADGFNSVIYCVPWREIQPEEDGSINAAPLAKLEEMTDRAEKAGLGVYLRLGYTWDYESGQSTGTLYTGAFRDSGIRRRWLDYAAVIYAAMSKHSNYQGAFLSWEDFWPFLNGICATYEEMDEKLLKLLEDTQKVYPGLSMECRLHNDYYAGEWHSHEATFGCAGAPYSAAMLAVSMGWPDGTSIPTEDALAMSQRMIDRMRAAGKPVFIDQFLYTETTPGYERLARPADTNAYLAGMGSVFKQSAAGYGIWTYKDYADSIVYNPEFGLGEKGWEFRDASIAEDGGNRRACIEAGGAIIQDLSGRGFSSAEVTKVRLRADSETGGKLTVTVGERVETAELVPGTQVIELRYPDQCRSRIRIESTGRVYVDDVKVYSHITEGEVYKLDGSQGAFLEGIRALNRNM